MRERRPDLLPVDDEFVTVADSCGAQARQVRTRIRFRIALAPDVLAGQYLRQIVRLLLLGAVGQEQRPDQADAVIRYARAAQPAPLLDIDHVLGRIRPMPPCSTGQVGESQPFFDQRVIPVRDLVEQRPLLAHVAQFAADNSPSTQIAENRPEFLVRQRVPVHGHQFDVLETAGRFSMKARMASLESSCGSSRRSGFARSDSRPSAPSSPPC